MAQVLQLRRGTTAQNDAFTGAAAEVSVDTDRKSLRVHDGSTLGGTEIANLKTAVPLLSAASSVSGSDTIPVIQSGVARKATKTQILNGIVDANIDAAADISGTKLANSAVTTAKIADSNVTTAKIADSNVTTAKIADSNVTTAKILNANVTSAKLAYDGGPMSGFRNRIINGNCQIDQRAVVATTNDAYFTDRWQVSASTTGAYQCSQSSDAPTGFAHSLVFDVTTADTSIAASEFAIIQQHIEGSSISDLSWGSASAQTVTLSFSVKATTTGTYCVALRNSANNRAYVAEYSVVSANTWERKTITISGDTSGTWLTTNGRGISVSFSFAAGSTYQTTAGSWQAGNFLGTSSQTNLLALTSNEIRVTGVQLEPGPAATPFEARPIGTELALCQRYYAQLTGVDTLPVTANVTNGRGFIKFPQTMRVAPTCTFTYSSGTGATWSIGSHGAYQGTNHSVAATVDVAASAEL